MVEQTVYEILRRMRDTLDVCHSIDSIGFLLTENDWGECYTSGAMKVKGYKAKYDLAAGHVYQSELITSNKWWEIYDKCDVAQLSILGKSLSYISGQIAENNEELGDFFCGLAYRGVLKKYVIVDSAIFKESLYIHITRENYVEMVSEGFFGALRGFYEYDRINSIVSPITISGGRRKF